MLALGSNKGIEVIVMFYGVTALFALITFLKLYYTVVKVKFNCVFLSVPVVRIGAFLLWFLSVLIC